MSLLVTLVITAFYVKISTTEPSVEELAQAARDINKEENILEPCNTNNSIVYCYGRLLEAVNVHGLYNDSKYFVDMPIKKSPDETIAAFNKTFGNQSLENINKTQLQQFVDDYFEVPGTELENCSLVDWQENPPKLMRIKDPKFREWALKLNLIWKSLCRKIRNTSKPSQHSLVYVPHQFIVPGGRFREFYYWDAYWILRGLAVCGLNSEMKNMILNFITCVRNYGFVPNGGRVYYLKRSQPPMLIPMAYVYYEATGDKNFIAEHIDDLVNEYSFWVHNRSISVNGPDNKQTYTVYQYHADSTTPRPESFRVDLISGISLPVEKRQKFYQDLASAAESGWDFSSRWFQDEINITTIQTTDIAPVDLNAFICYNLGILTYLYRELGNDTEAEKYLTERLKLRAAMAQVFYNRTAGTWFDYEFKNLIHNTRFYGSMGVPLFADCYIPLDLPTPEHAVDYMNVSSILSYRGGIPTSLVDSGQQWDFPNGWSPLQHMLIEGLRISQDPYAQEMAFQIAQKWLRDNYEVYEKTKHMYEKYDITGTLPAAGSGGEYEVQTGFGWTNGAALDLLSTYAARLTVSDEEPKAAPILERNYLLLIALLSVFIIKM